MKEHQDKQNAVMGRTSETVSQDARHLMEALMQFVNRAAERGQSEVQIYRLPNSLCTDRGRRINNSEPEWDQTLEGRSRLGYEFWHDHLRPLGFGRKAQVLESPGEMPGNIGFFLTW